MLKVGTKVKIKQDAVLTDFDLMGNKKFKINNSPLMNATGIVIGVLGDKHYISLDNERLFMHDAQNGPIAALEKDLEIIA